jgi:type I restriction enzyme M protein
VPAKNGDYAFLLHILTSLKSTGKGAVILPHGVLFRGGAEAAIRRKHRAAGLIKGIIGLPANLFYGTGIPACILVLDKEGAWPDARHLHDRRQQGLHQGRQQEPPARAGHPQDRRHLQPPAGAVPSYSRMVPLAEIEANDFNLNLPRYIDSSEPEDLQDIEAHLKGGIPEPRHRRLAAYWQVLPGVRAKLFADWQMRPTAPATASCWSEPARSRPPSSGTRSSPPSTSRCTRFAAWNGAAPLLTGIKKGDRPKHLIETLSESLLEPSARPQRSGAAR